ncbi:MAG: bifunctional 5,10-methylenetetrahydrofolate dehydrogenase/5,10-methenyltetrahydrofolate cyclohydrolase [Bacteriovorax sp.]|nr:bifunctional 5,10-methylenetetrahydrofolate dehydrogenase/5,10-methenyltetrahydrofolate cyclohydrolase [Bacteriovorax sp.]
MTQILSSIAIKKKITKELKLECRFLLENGIEPYLKVILVGSNPASLVYTASKKKFCEKIGAKCDIIALNEQIDQNTFLDIIAKINLDTNVHGCIIQLPLPKHLSHLDIGKLVNEDKDVDGFHPNNLYALFSNHEMEKHFTSCTPKGIVTLLVENNIEIANKRVAIIGRSMIVGKPLACLLTNLNATVTLCHSKTLNLREITKEVDIIISAVGIAHLIDETFISHKKNQIVVDVGMNTDTQGQLCGDVNFERVKDHVLAITPVPGGVGPMTIISLAQNLLQASKKKVSL